jgi:hypothetical protein
LRKHRVGLVVEVCSTCQPVKTLYQLLHLRWDDSGPYKARRHTVVRWRNTWAEAGFGKVRMRRWGLARFGGGGGVWVRADVGVAWQRRLGGTGRAVTATWKILMARAGWIAYKNFYNNTEAKWLDNYEAKWVCFGILSCLIMLCRWFRYRFRGYSGLFLIMA